MKYPFKVTKKQTKYKTNVIMNFLFYSVILRVIWALSHNKNQTPFFDVLMGWIDLLLKTDIKNMY